MYYLPTRRLVLYLRQNYMISFRSWEHFSRGLKICVICFWEVSTQSNHKIYGFGDGAMEINRILIT
jgi:hypothetical protein